MFLFNVIFFRLHQRQACRILTQIIAYTGPRQNKHRVEEMIIFRAFFFFKEIEGQRHIGYHSAVLLIKIVTIFA